MSELRRKIGLRLRAARESLRLTHEDIGNMIGLSATGYGNYERGTRAIPIEQLLRLADVLGRSVNYFLDSPADTGDLTPEEERLLRYFRMTFDPSVRQALVELAHHGAYPFESTPGRGGRQ